jgi:hypothetical protein
MSKIFVNLESKSTNLQQENLNHLKKTRKARKFLTALFLVFLVTGGYFYWQSIKRSPHYSLALLVEASKADDAEKIKSFVDSDALVDNFVPQVTDKAIELYGRNVAPEKIKQIAAAISPILPTVKQRVREEIPRIIKEKTKPFERIPWLVIAIGADKVLETRIEGDLAYITSRDPSARFELTMRREGEFWKVIAIKDENLARQIAEKIGQEITSSSKKENLRKVSEGLGISLEELMKKIDNVF